MSGAMDYNYLSQDNVRPISQTISQWQQVQKNQLDIQQAQAQVEQGKALQQAIDPQTGQFDQAKYNQLLAQNPMAARGAAQAAQAGVNIDTDTYKLHTARMSQANDAIGNLIGRYPNGIPQDAAHAAVDQEVSTGLITAADGATLKTRFGADPRQNSIVATQLYSHNMNTQQQLDQMYGRTGTVTGPSGALTGYVQAPASQGGGISTQPQQGAPQGMSPEGTAAYQRWLQEGATWTDPKNPNVQKSGTNAQRLTELGVNPQLIFPGGAPATPGTSPQSPLGTGRLPPALQNPNKPQAAPAAPSAAAPGIGTAASGPTPAQAAAAAATEEGGKLGPPQFQAEAARSADAQNQQAILGNMLSDTSQFTTGPLAGIVGKVRNLAGNLGLSINTEGQSAKESFNKLAAGLALAQGSQTDNRMNVSISANPHEELSPAGVDLILRQLQGNSDYIRARASLAAKYPNKADYPGFQESIKDLDPRVFQMARMTGPQRTTYWNSLDSEAKKQIDANGRKAAQLGVLGGG